MNRMARGAGWIFRWAWPLIVLAGTIYAVWRSFAHFDFSTEDDSWILAGVGATYLVAIVFLVAFTQRWTMRGLGQLATYCADAGLYGGLSAAQLGWRHNLTAGEQNLIRAGFVVGGSCLVLGLIWWGASTRGGTRDPSSTVKRKTW